MFQGAKPEGICVELIDGVIRILDYIAHCGEADKYNKGTDWCFEMCGKEGEKWTNEVRAMSLPALVNKLHNNVHLAWTCKRLKDEKKETEEMLEAARVAWQWIKGRGLDPEELLIEKHEYNVTRPYKHGKVC